MASRTLKKNKRTKYGRTRRQRRRQMGGVNLFDFFKPTVETNETCKKKYDKCLDKVAGKDDSFSFSSLNFFGSSDSAATTVKGDEKKGGEFEMEEYPVAAPAEPVVVAPTEPVVVAPTEPVVAAPAKQEDADLNLDENTNDVAAEQEQAKKMKMSQVPLPPPTMSSSPMMSSMSSSPMSSSMSSSPMSSPPSPPMMAAETGGGSRKKYKKRNANRSKKNKNRRNKRRTNKRN